MALESSSHLNRLFITLPLPAGSISASGPWQPDFTLTHTSDSKCEKRDAYNTSIVEAKFIPMNSMVTATHTHIRPALYNKVIGEAGGVLE